MGKFNLEEFKQDTVQAAKSAAGGTFMNIKFTDENRKYLKKEAALCGTSITGLVNVIVAQYRSDPDHVHEVYQDN